LESDDPKILFWEGGVKGQIASPRCSDFLTEIDDLPSNYCILKENAKTTLREGTFNLGPSQSLPAMHPSG
jgi:hypothetical protein